ncbi:MAG: transglutaminase domain-containing protein [Candidatus Bathyarchaeota archaeon]|nr:MAG: transglutaminase domain-containing protein [Candidatus Bathyarchaeota archaeon]
MRKASLTPILLVLLVSLFLLSVLSNVLTGYPERPDSPTPDNNGTGGGTTKDPAILLFKVSPIEPQLYARVSTADYYTGFNWIETTNEKVIAEFNQTQNVNASKVFTVEINATQQETVLPIPSPYSTLENLSLTQIEGAELYVDTIGDVYTAVTNGPAMEMQLVYNVSWRDVEVDDELILLDNTPEEFLNTYLQLPDIPAEVWELAEDLEDSSYSILDQILADIQYLRTNLVYDVDARARADDLMQIPQGSNVLFCLQQGKGICIDAATVLAVILRIQNIPARISFGYKPGRMEGDKLLYFSTGGHAVTEVYLPPYGWIQFDATPPPKEVPRVDVFPFKKVGSPGSRLLYQLSITNRHTSEDTFKLSVESKQRWNVTAAPKKMNIGTNQTADTLLEVAVPENASLGQKDVVTLTVASTDSPAIAFSILAIVQAENILQTSTNTELGILDETVIRGNTFWVNGTVLTASNEQIDNMTVFVFLTESRETEGVVVGKGYSKQGNFQIESVVPHSMEIGDYKLIAISLGTTQYAPSSNSSTTRVRATTRIKLGPEERFLIGYGAIHGRLLWDNGTGFAGVPISFKITLLTPPSETWVLQDSTLKNGTFRLKTTFENPGEHEVKIMFSGNEYVLGSNATSVVELERGVPTIQVFGEDTAVRGEVFSIVGAVQFQGLGVWGENITVVFDDQLLATVETKDSGSYSWFFPVDPEEELGIHRLEVALEKSNISAVHEIAVKSETKLTARVSNIAGGMFLLYSASLSDDHDLPIEGAEIVVDNYGLSWKTYGNGSLTFLLDTIKFWPEDLVLTTRFEGSEFYLPVAIEKDVALDLTNILQFFIPLVSPILIAMGFAYTKHFARRPSALLQTSDADVAEEKMVVEEETESGSQELQPLGISLPSIGAGFPKVWGVRDKLHVEIALDESVSAEIQKRDVEVLIDEENVASIRLSQQGQAEFSHSFIKKGRHKIQAILPRTTGRRPLKAEIRLRIVDYEEEVIRLYNAFVETLANHNISAGNEMTVREIERLILGTGDFDPEPLRKVTICFEKAEYSNHLTTRKDYEIMYLSLKELNVDVE